MVGTKTQGSFTIWTPNFGPDKVVLFENVEHLSFIVAPVGIFIEFIILVVSLDVFVTCRP